MASASVRVTQDSPALPLAWVAGGWFAALASAFSPALGCANPAELAPDVCSVLGAGSSSRASKLIGGRIRCARPSWQPYRSWLHPSEEARSTNPKSSRLARTRLVVIVLIDKGHILVDLEQL